MNTFKESASDPAVKKEMKDWYSLCPEAHRNTAKQRHVNMEYDEDFNSWVGPFIMASVNTRVVLRTNALLNEQYGRQFYYEEGSLTGTGDAGRKAAKRVALGTKLFGAVLMLTPLQWLALKFFTKPGEGPSPDEQRADSLICASSAGRSQGEVRVKVTGDRDPGYGSTAKMIAQ